MIDRLKSSGDDLAALDQAIDPKFPRHDALELKIDEERRIPKMRIVDAVRLDHRVRSAVYGDFERIAVREDRRALSKSPGALWPEVPVEVGFDDRTNTRVALGHLKARAQFGNSKDIGDSRILQVFVRIRQLG